MPKHDNIGSGCKEIDGEIYCKPGASVQLGNKGFFLTGKQSMWLLLLPGINILWTTIVSLCSGFATGDWTTALGYAGFTIAIGLYVLLCFVPGYGIYLLAGWDAFMADLFASFGTAANSWIDFLVDYYFGWGVFFQVVIWIVIAIVIIVLLSMASG